MDECIFCKIVRGEIPSSKVFENEQFLAFMDINPVNKGHTLVIPKKHYETFNDIPTLLLPEYMKLIQKISVAVVKASGAQGYNLFVNNKASAGQVVPHVHFHILPRFLDDGIKFSWDTQNYDGSEMEEFRKKIEGKL